MAKIAILGKFGQKWLNLYLEKLLQIETLLILTAIHTFLSVFEIYFILKTCRKAILGNFERKMAAFYISRMVAGRVPTHMLL